MNSGSGTTVSAELGMRLVAADESVVPLAASLHYSGSDPYAVRMSFHVGTDEPIEWIFARELLADGLVMREGDGDVRVWPSEPLTGSLTAERIGSGVLHLELSSPFGQAHFEAPAGAIASFLDRTFEIVPMGQESGMIDIDAELESLLREA